MQGHVFPIKDVRTSSKVTISHNDAGRHYFFHVDDLEPVDAIKEQKPIEFKFDERLLDI